MGLYERVDTFFERPVYLHQDEPEYLFYMGGRSRGLWMIGPEVGTFSGGLANRADRVTDIIFGKSIFVTQKIVVSFGIFPAHFFLFPTDKKVRLGKE